MDIYSQIAQLAYLALVAEVDATPKPGLVDKHDSGAHKDMDYHTFMRSARAIKPYLYACAAVSAKVNQPDSTTLQLLRPLGVKAEEEMFRATDGVNTHKGAIFSMGVLCCAAGIVYRQRRQFDPQHICSLAAVIAAPALADFARIDPDRPKTKGELLYLRHQITGIRGEAASGFATVTSYGLPVLSSMMDNPLYTPNQCRLNALLSLMAKLKDTNILSRSDMPTLIWVQSQSAALLQAGGATTKQGINTLRLLNQEFIRHNISPGGSADLLAIAIFLDALSRLPKGEFSQ